MRLHHITLRQSLTIPPTANTSPNALKLKHTYLKGRNIMDNLSVNDLIEKVENTDVTVWREAAEHETDTLKRKLLFSMYNYAMGKKQTKIINEPGFTI